MNLQFRFKDYMIKLYTEIIKARMSVFFPGMVDIQWRKLLNSIFHKLKVLSQLESQKSEFFRYNFPEYKISSKARKI